MDGAKQRFSSFKAFKFTTSSGGGGSQHQPPPVPPKEYPAGYNSRSFGSISSSSLVPTQHLGPSSENLVAGGAGAPESPAYSYTAAQSQQSLHVAGPSPLGMSTQHPNGSGYFNEGSSSSHGHGHGGQQQHNGNGSGNGGFRKSIMKLTSLSRKPFNRQASHQSSMTSLREDQEVPQPAQEDPGISIPWGFQHHVHVTEDFSGLPQSWAEQLSAQGLSESEILQMHARAMQARAGTSSASSSPLSAMQQSSMFRPPDRNASLPPTDDPTASPVIVVGPNGHALHHPHGLPDSRPGTPQSAAANGLTVRTNAPLTVTNANGPLDTAVTMQLSPPPSYSATSSSQQALAAVAAGEKGRPAVPPSRPIPPTPPPGQQQHVQSTSDDSDAPVVDARALMRSDDSHSRGPSYDALSNNSSHGLRSQHSIDYLRQEPVRQDTMSSLNARPLEYQELDVHLPGDNVPEEDEEDEDRPVKLPPRPEDLQQQQQQQQQQEQQYDSPEEDEADEDEEEDAPSALPSPLFKLAVMPPRLSLHQSDGGFDFASDLFSSLGDDALLTLAPSSLVGTTPPASSSRPPVHIERPPSMLPDSPGLSDGTATPGVRSPATPNLPRVASPLSAPSQTIDFQLPVSSRSSTLGSNLSPNSALPSPSPASAGGFSIADFPMPPSAVPMRGNSSPAGSRSTSPSPTGLGAPTNSSWPTAGSPGSASTPVPSPSVQPPQSLGGSSLTVATNPTVLRPTAPSGPTPFSAGSTYSHGTEVQSAQSERTLGSAYSQGTEAQSAASRYSSTSTASPNTELANAFHLASAYVDEDAARERDKPPPTPAKDTKFLPSVPAYPTGLTSPTWAETSVRDSTASVANATIGVATRVASPTVVAVRNVSGSGSGRASPATSVPSRTQSPAIAIQAGRSSPASVPSRTQSPAMPPSRQGTMSPTAHLLSPVSSSPSLARPAPPVKLGIDVSAPPVSKTPGSKGHSPAQSPTTAVLSQLVSSHFPPSPSASKQSSKSPSPSGLSRGTSTRRKPVPRLSVDEVPAPPPVRSATADTLDVDADEEGGGASALDAWLAEEGDGNEEDDDEERMQHDDDGDTNESVLDSWLTSNAGDESATTPSDSPAVSPAGHFRAQQQHQLQQKTAPTGALPTPPVPSNPALPSVERNDIPVLRVDTAAATAPRNPRTDNRRKDSSTREAPETGNNTSQPWLQGSPAPRDRPVYLPAELEELRPLIHLSTDPRALFGEMILIAQGQYGDVFAVQNGGPPCAVKAAPLHLSAPLTPASAAMTPGDAEFVATMRTVKVSPKMAMLKHELLYIGKMRHEHVLAMDALYFVEDSLWIKMELMVRSLADLVGLCGEVEGEGEFDVHEREVARFAADTLEALKYIEGLGIAHRDVRSDNLLLNADGAVKLADFSHAVKKAANEPLICRDIVGVAYWRAAEINSGPYDAMRVDVWSLGATVWELMESEPPFERSKQLASRWPPLQRSGNPSAELQEFLRLCSNPPSSRPPAAALLQSSWIRTACKRSQIVALLEKAREIEESLALEEEE